MIKCKRCWKIDVWVHTCTILSEHERLKAICDEIGYEYKWFYIFDDEFWLCKNIDWTWIEIDVREIIFTPEFMDKYMDYFYTNIDWREYIFNEHIHNLINYNLDNPTLYLYNLLLWNK